MHLFKKSILLISLFSLVFTAEKIAVTAEGNTNDGRNCAEGQTADCNGDCFNSQTLESFIGDGFCDDGTYGMVLVCLEHNCDGGDCNNGDPSADCSGQCGGNHFIDSCDECVLELVDGDGDLVADSCDVCPLDANDDSDGDGSCDSDDVCPLDADNDADGDGVCGDVDVCEGYDDNVDTDSDGVADGCDVCPNDLNDDSDGDELCDSDDEYPNCAANFYDCADVCGGDSYVDECGACNADASDDFVCLDITGLNATGGLNEVFLQWDSNDSVSSYNIYRDGELIGSTPAEVPGYVDSSQGDGFGLGYDTQYCYTVTGVSATDTDGNGSLGEGADSEAACATTLPALQAFLQLNTSLANQEVAAVASPFGDLTDDGVADGVIMVEMVNLLPVNGYQFNFALTPGIVDVVAAFDGTSIMTGGAAGLMAQMGPNTVIGFDMTGQGSIPAGFPGNPTGVEGNLLAVLVLDSEYTGVGSSVDVTISDFVVSGIYNGQNIGLASCDADQNPFNGCLLYTSPSPRDS